MCDIRGDPWAEEVRVRLSDSRCASDLHAADGRYHEDCRKNFTRLKPFLDSSSSNVVDYAFNIVSDLFGSDESKMWTSE